MQDIPRGISTRGVEEDLDQTHPHLAERINKYSIIQPCVAKTCKDEKVFSDQGRKKKRVTWEARIVDLFQLLRSTIDCPQPRGKAAFQCRYFDISFFDTGESR